MFAFNKAADLGCPCAGRTHHDGGSHLLVHHHKKGGTRLGTTFQGQRVGAGDAVVIARTCIRCHPIQRGGCGGNGVTGEGGCRTGPTLIACSIGGPSNHGVVAIGQTVEAQTPDTLGIGRCGGTRGAIHFHGDLTARFGLALHPGLQITGELVGIDQVAQQNTFDHRLIRGYRIDCESALGGCRTIASGVIRRDGNLPNTIV